MYRGVRAEVDRAEDILHDSGPVGNSGWRSPDCVLGVGRYLLMRS
ncbi:hypothetical protein SAMN05443572_103254 [Myxococcus fulvus]|uniref:Uncharacterized protein n=1 Tax=Myxococcus fulvus TaxID=33 RepID=A0ABY1C860_MYXFU|nr:hypothetical protein SAMN05443572_103254 [Myxococcus fulvus]